MKHYVTTDYKKQPVKPSGKLASQISRELVEEVYPESVSEFLEFVEFGCSWSPATFTGSRNNNNWKAQSILALDFDGGLEPKEAIDRSIQFGLKPNTWYPTFGDTPAKRKFRLVFFLDQVIKDLKVRNWLMDGLLELFPEADSACKDPAHIFFGTNKKGEVLSEEYVSTILLENVIDSQLITSSKGRTYKISDESLFSQDLSSLRKSSTSYNNTIGGNGNSQDYEEWLDGQRNNPFDFEKAQQRVKVFRDFMKGKWLTHPEIFGLATSLYWVQGGLLKMKRTMQKWTDDPAIKTNYTSNNFNALKSARKKRYMPQHLSEYSEYEEDHKKINLIEAVKEPRGQIVRTEKINRMSLHKAENYFQHKLYEGLDSLEEKLFIYRLTTGMGKSYNIKGLDGVTIAAPTNDLKQELYKRRDDPATAIMTPETPAFNEAILNQRLLRLYRSGLGKAAQQLLWDLRNRKIGKKEDQDLAKEYLEGTEKAKNSTKTVFTTHKRAMYTPFSHDTIIFDEDPLSLLLSVDTLKVADLKKVDRTLNIFRNKEKWIIDLQRYLESVKEGEILTLPEEFEVDLHQFSGTIMSIREMESNIVEFLNCKFFYKDPNNRDKIHFVNKNEMPKDKQIIIMSATVPVDIYQKLYGEDNVEVVDVSDVEHVGTIKQYTSKSYSRSSLDKSLCEVENILDGNPTITFMSFKDHIDNAVSGMHFGNTEGYDSLKGQDINVLGTPHKHNSQYLLMGKSLGINTDDREFSYQLIEWNGFRFKFNTFNNPDLRDLQLSLIESELLQAAGRARPLREPATVNVYSNLPLRITEEFIY